MPKISVLSLTILTALFSTTISAQTVSTFAGSGQASFLDAQGTGAAFQYPYGIAITPANAMYVGDANNNRVRKISATGNVSTLAGSSMGYADGFAEEAQFNVPMGVAINSVGTVFVADRNNHRIRKITPAGIVTTLAGGTQGYADGNGTLAKFSSPTGVVCDADGNVIVSDSGNNRIRKITPAGVVTTIAGSIQGELDGQGTSAQFNYPTNVAIDADGVMYVSDSGNNRIRKITTTGQVSTFAGSTSGNADGTGTAAQFNYPQGLAIDLSGTILVTDTNNHRIRKITPGGIVTTLTGSDAGFTEGSLATAKFDSPYNIAVNANTGTLVVVDAGNQRIRKIEGALGISDATRSKVGIYPNPASSVLHIEMPDYTKASATVCDLNGRVLQTNILGSGQTSVDISNLSNGVYIVQVRFGTDSSFHKIIKE
ncbi:T9SS type A sorting domain-containing protein [Flavobacterium silvaticum]|uniref:T9SS type A sorting domain-containing protein n=1 Tax=Flavobacterium silvaticum TaxID=1852020 RepID=A0A972FN22_9FLAO|nr:T9SS type A sorting domain-containing protein [Flavobacterium silvaticum]NMH28728.1 T9SS type A sorting domain-containing protein [Flavobacterium silvaticum]